MAYQFLQHRTNTQSTEDSSANLIDIFHEKDDALQTPEFLDQLDDKTESNIDDSHFHSEISEKNSELSKENFKIKLIYCGV